MSTRAINFFTRRTRIVIVAAILMGLTWGTIGLPPSAHGDSACGNGFYCLPVQKGVITDSTSYKVGEYGSSTEYQWASPNPDSHPAFYSGIEAVASPANGCCDFYGVSNLHTTISITDPTGTAVAGQYVTIDEVSLSPDSSSGNAKTVLTFIYNAMLNALPYGIGSDIQNAASNGGTSHDTPGNTAYANWSTCGDVACYGDPQHGLYMKWHFNIGGGISGGTFVFSVHYHVEITHCSFDFFYGCNPSNKPVTSQDVYDTYYYCYNWCSGIGLGAGGSTVTLVAGAPATDLRLTISTSLSPFILPPYPMTMSATSNDPAITTTFNPTAIQIYTNGGDHPRPPSGYGDAFVSLAANSCKSGTFTLTLTAQGQGLSVSVILQILEPCDFSISASQPNPSTIAAGGSSTSTVTLNGQGLSGNVQLSSTITGPSCSICPVITFSTNPVPISSPGSPTSTMTISTSASTTTGSYSVTITGTGSPGGISHSTSVAFQVTGTLTLSSAPSSVAADGSSSSTITVQTSDNQPNVVVSFSSNLGTLSSSSCTTGSSGSCAVTIKSLFAGVATITATASGYPTRQVSVTFFDFSATVSPTAISTGVGTASTATVSLTSLNGFAGTVSLVTNVLQNPAGMGCSVSPSSVTLGSSAAATVTCTPTQPGTYTVVVFASSGTLTHEPTIAYTVSTLGPTIDGTATAGCGHTTNQCQTTFSTTHTNDIIIVYTFESLDLAGPCTFSVSDTAGLTWNYRGGVAGRADGWYGTTPRDQIGEFWARSSGALASDSITERISGCADTRYGYGGEYNGLQVFGVSGANFNSPFDPNTSLPGSANNYSNTPSVAVSTSTSNDLIISAAQQTSYGALTPGAGFTGIYSNVEYQSAYSPVTNLAVTFGDTATWYWELIADAIRPMPPALDGSAQAGCSHYTNSCSLTFSTSHPFDIIIVYTTEALDLAGPCTFSVQDTAGLTWSYRGGVAGRADGWYGTTPRDQIGEFWAKSAGILSSDTITESISGCADTQYGYGGEYNGLQVFGITGANYNNPFDPNVSLPGTANAYNNTPSATISTTLSNDMIISAGQQTSYGTLTPGSGFTGITANTEYQVVNSSVTNFAVTFGDTATWYWEMMADAIQ